MPALVGVAALAGLVWLGSKAVENIGGGIDDASNGVLKLTVAAGVVTVGYFALKNAKIL